LKYFKNKKKKKKKKKKKNKHDNVLVLNTVECSSIEVLEQIIAIMMKLIIINKILIFEMNQVW